MVLRENLLHLSQNQLRAAVDCRHVKTSCPDWVVYKVA